MDKNKKDLNVEHVGVNRSPRADARIIHLYEEFIRSLSGGIANCALYPSSHPMVQSSIDQIYQIIPSLFDKISEITMGLVDQRIVVEGIRLDMVKDMVDFLSSRLLKRKIEKIVLSKGLTKNELLIMAQILAQEPEEIKKQGGAEEILIGKGVRHVRMRRLGTDEIFDEDTELAKKTYKEGLETVKEILPETRKKGIVNLEKAKGFIAGLIKNIMHNPAPFVNLASLKNHDEYTFTHGINVSILTVAQGQLMGFSEEVLNEFGIAGLMHDIGKEKVPLEILNKKGKLTDKEFVIIEKHTIYGAKTLLNSPTPNEFAAIVAYEHQIKYDLTGYPELFKKRKLNLCSMITTISDVFDALKSVRPYRGEMPSEKAILILAESAGTHFEPTLLKRFIQMIGIYPPGTLVRLNTDQLGIVYKANFRDSFRPQVKLLSSSDGSKVNSAQLINLWEKDEKTGKYKNYILKSEDPSELGIEPGDYL